MKHDYTDVKNIYIICGKTDMRKGIDGSDLSHSLKKWREPQFIDLWIGLTGLRTSIDSSLYFHSLWCSDDFFAAWMANGRISGVRKCAFLHEKGHIVVVDNIN